jgi:site-specific DNA-cytosine methylase
LRSEKPVKTKPVSVSVRSPRQSLPSQLKRTAGKSRPASANSRGIYETSDFELSRPHKAAGQLEFSVRANRVEAGQWIAEATWHSRSQHLPGDGQYRVQHRTLNATGFGVPQSRERSFIVATRLGLPADEVLGYVFPEEQAPTTTVEDILEPGIPATIADHEIELHTKEPAKRTTELVEVGLIGGKDCQGYRVYSPKGIGATMTASGGGRARCTGAYRVAGGARGLTPREASRMQGLPEWAAHHPVTTHALRHAGNAVAVPLARELGRQLAAHLVCRT